MSLTLRARNVIRRRRLESVTDAAMRKSVEPVDWNRLSNLAFDQTLAKKLARRRGSVDRYSTEASFYYRIKDDSALAKL